MMPEAEPDVFGEEEKEPNSTGSFFTKERLKDDGGNSIEQDPFSNVQDDGGDIVEFEGKKGIWRTNNNGKPYFCELESVGERYYTKDTGEIYLPKKEYAYVLNELSPEKLNDWQKNNETFIKELPEASYLIQRTKNGYLILDKK